MHRRTKNPLAVLHVVMAEQFTNIRHTYVPDTALEVLLGLQITFELLSLVPV